MKSFLFLALFGGLCAKAADTPKAPPEKPKSKLNTQIYENESEEVSFEAVVKLIRNIQGDTEVFFEGKQGFYTLITESLQSPLLESQKHKFPVRVTVSTANRQILKVELRPQGKN